MYKQLAMAALAATAFIAPASAEVLLPNLYAHSYCEMRNSGADHKGSLRWAIRQSMVSGEPIQVTVNGETVDADVLAAHNAAKNLCPQYF